MERNNKFNIRELFYGFLEAVFQGLLLATGVLLVIILFSYEAPDATIPLRIVVLAVEVDTDEPISQVIVDYYLNNRRIGKLYTAHDGFDDTGPLEVFVFSGNAIKDYYWHYFHPKSRYKIYLGVEPGYADIDLRPQIPPGRNLCHWNMRSWLEDNVNNIILVKIWYTPCE